jgi:CDP-diacylglycerol--glycerol-3-phosphate 3-phosphatidyltransferase
VLVKDVYFAYFMFGTVVLTAIAYGLRVATRGVARSERVGRIGGTALVGQGVMETTYWLVEPIVRGLAALGVTANGLTWSALVFGLAAGVAVALGWFGLGCLLATFSTICDILDGQVARLTNSGSNKGELLDAAIDRYTEFALVGGFAVYFRDSLPYMALALATLLACFMVSYASAKAEALHVSPPRGLMRRHERAVYLITPAGLTSLCGAAIHARLPDVPSEVLILIGMAAVAVIGNFAEVQRLVRIGRAL